MNAHSRGKTKIPPILILFCLFFSFVYAEKVWDGESYIDIIPQPAGNSGAILTTVIEPIRGNSSITNTWLFRKVLLPVFPTSMGGGFISKKVSTPYYDLIIWLSKDRYEKKDLIEYKITIINKGYEPDRDGVMKIYLKDPRNHTYRESQMTFELIPPTCRIGDYDQYNDTCVTADGRSYPPSKTIIPGNMTAPIDAITGEWKFYVEYQTYIQPLIVSYLSFDIYKTTFPILIWLLVIILGMAVARKYVKVVKDKKKKKLEVVVPA